MCQGGKLGIGKLYTDVCLCCSGHTSGCVVDGLGATATLSVPNLYLAQRYYYRGWYCSRGLSPQFIVEITVTEKGHSYDYKKVRGA